MKDKRIYAVLISLLMIFMLLPFTALAAQGDTYDDGTLKYTELADGTLSIAGISSTYSGGGSITIPASYSGKAVTAISERAFENNTTITSAAIPASVTSIGMAAFNHCRNLSSVTFATDSRLNTIWNGAFDSTALTSVAIPSGVTSIGDNAFIQCKSLSSVTFAVNSSLKTIGDGAFESTALTSVAIPSGVTSIGQYAFIDNGSLSSVTFAADSSLNTIKYQAFCSTALTSVAIPSGVTSIGEEAFNHCLSLSSVTFAANSSLKTIGDSAFCSTALTSVAIPSGVTSIGESAFDSCGSLSSVTFAANSGLNTIGVSAFYSTALTSVTIPSGVTSIGDSAFDSCDKLSKAAILSKTATFGSNVFSGAPMTDGIYGFSGSPAQTYASANSITFHAFCQVTFDSRGGSDVHSVGVVSGEAVNKPADPTQDGKVFSGWYSASDCSGSAVSFPYTITADTTLYAKWTPLYTVTFDSKGGSSVSSQSVAEGAKAVKPSDPVLDGSAFGGWYSDAALTHAWDFDSNTVTDNITLYAKWASSSYTVTFDPKGGSSVSSQSVAEGAKVVKPTNPTLANNVFGGWYSDAALTHAWDFDSDTVTANITLYAKWTPLYTVTFDSKGGSSVSSQSVAEGAKVVKPTNPTLANNVFGGWYSDAGLTHAWDFDSDTVTANITLYAKWTPLYTVTFDSKGGSSVSPQTVEKGAKAVKPTDPVLAGSVFGGWYSDAALTHAWNFDSDTVTDNITLYAKWTPLYTVTFDLKGGSSVSPQTVEKGAKAVKPTDPVLAGSVFGGWYSDAALTHAWNFDSDTVTDNITLYAKWTPLYTVTFDSKGGSSVSSQTVEEGLKAARPSDPVLDGSVFGGWYKDAALTHAWDFDSDTVTANITLYAKWTPLYTVTFDSKGGSSVSPQTVEKGAKAVKPTDPVLAGSVFGGWYSDAALTHEWNFDSDTVTDNITLYAKWTSSYTVTFDLKGGSSVSPQTVEKGAKAVKPTDPVLAGSVFGGWYSDAALTHAWNFDSDTVTANITLYAKWTAFSISPSTTEGKVYTGGRIIMTPSIPGGTWSYDSNYFSLSGDTFTALKAGTSTITYTVNGQSVGYTVMIKDAALPQTGQNFGLVYVFFGLACIAAVIGSLIVCLKKKVR